MMASYQLSGYSKTTERLAMEIAVPQQWLGYVIDVAGVDRSKDPDAFGVYPIAESKLVQFDILLKSVPAPDAYDWFLEAFEDEHISA
jgi:hypothetical protein